MQFVIKRDTSSLQDNPDQSSEPFIEQEQSLKDSTEDKPIQIQPVELYKFNEVLCRAYDWCWCGYINSLDEYNSGIKNTNLTTDQPKIVVDCRSLSLRPFEDRNLTDDSIDNGISTYFEYRQETFEIFSNESLVFLNDQRLGHFLLVQLYMHQRGLCSPKVYWCWCGFIRSYEEYSTSKKTAVEKRKIPHTDCNVPSRQSVPKWIGSHEDQIIQINQDTEFMEKDEAERKQRQIERQKQLEKYYLDNESMD